MKKLIALLVVGFMVLSVFPAGALAGTATEPIDTEEEVLIDKVMTPDSPFYFLKRVSESLQTLFTFRNKSRISLRQRLAEERVKEYLALQAKYSEQELTDENLTLLDKALDDVVVYYDNLMVVMDLEDDDPGVEIEYGDDDDEDGQKDDDDEEGLDDDDEEGLDGQAGDKYEIRIAHLERIMAKVPEAAHQGLGRAIENARRQQERFAQRTPDDEDGLDEDDEDVDADDDDDELDIDDDDDDDNDLNLESQPEKGNQGKGKVEKVKENGKGNDKDKVSPGQVILDKVRQLINPGKGR